MKHPLFNEQGGFVFSIKGEHHPLFYPASIPVLDKEGRQAKDKSGKSLCMFPVLDNYDTPLVDERGLILFVTPRVDE
jgi:hypothetical protein